MNFDLGSFFFGFVCGVVFLFLLALWFRKVDGSVDGKEEEK